MFMKKFNELEVGDEIYYWDHGKLNKQTVTSVRVNEESMAIKNWDGSVRENKRYRVIFSVQSETGYRISTYNIVLWSEDMSDNLSDYSYTMIFGCRRFSCIEAANHWLKIQKDKALTRATYAEMMYKKETKKLEAYSRALANSKCKKMIANRSSNN